MVRQAFEKLPGMYDVSATRRRLVYLPVHEVCVDRSGAREQFPEAVVCAHQSACTLLEFYLYGLAAQNIGEYSIGLVTRQVLTNQGFSKISL